MFNTALLSNWRNWVRVTIMLFIGFTAAHLISNAFTGEENEEE